MPVQLDLIPIIAGGLLLALFIAALIEFGNTFTRRTS